MKRGMWWPIGLAGVLAATVAANIWVAAIANDDPSFAIEPDYYRKAVAWDTTLAQARHNALLGWRLTPAMSAIASDGSSLLSARLTDSTGSEISGAVIRVSALAVARASDVHDMTLTPCWRRELRGALRCASCGRMGVALRRDARSRAFHAGEPRRIASERRPSSRRRGICRGHRGQAGHYHVRAGPSSRVPGFARRDDGR